MARMARVNVPLEKDLRNKIKRWAARLDVTEANFCRRLIQWGCERYARGVKGNALDALGAGQDAAPSEKRKPK
jgi:hypothetical protein